MTLNKCSTGILFTMFEADQRICLWFITFSLLIRYVTLVLWLDLLWPWTFLMYDCSHMIKLCTKWLRNGYEIEQSAAELLPFKYVQFENARHFGFGWKWISTISQPQPGPIVHSLTKLTTVCAAAEIFRPVFIWERGNRTGRRNGS